MTGAHGTKASESAADYTGRSVSHSQQHCVDNLSQQAILVSGSAGHLADEPLQTRPTVQTHPEDRQRPVRGTTRRYSRHARRSRPTLRTDTGRSGTHRSLTSSTSSTLQQTRRLAADTNRGRRVRNDTARF